MHDRALTADELAALPALKHFNRMLTGDRPGAARAIVEAITGNDEEYQPDQKKSAPKMFTPRQVNQARGIGYAMREAYRRANWQARRQETEEATASAPAYRWEPARPARRTATR